MPLAKTRAERQRQGALDTAKKMRLEIPFAKDIRRILKAISDDFYNEYIRSGTVIDVNAYRDDLNAALKKNYRNIMAKFKNNLRSEKAINENIEGTLKQYIDTHSVAQTGLILNTTNELLNEDLRGSIFALAESGQELTNENIADLTWKKNSARVAGRANTIATTETQNMAETTKQTEADELAIAGAVVAGVTIAQNILKKRWSAFLDEKTRANHAIADGQVRNITQPFIVNGQLLNYPGDSSLGASAGNVVNCRCWVTYEV